MESPGPSSPPRRPTFTHRIVASCKEREPEGPGGIRTRPIKCRDGTLVYPWSIPPRDQMIKKLKTETFDVLVIGGGCVGAGGACVRACVVGGGAGWRGGAGWGMTIRSSEPYPTHTTTTIHTDACMLDA
jgi:hypothetical protein